MVAKRGAERSADWVGIQANLCISHKTLNKLQNSTSSSEKWKNNPLIVLRLGLNKTP